ncbi:MAG TPA: hypothetical protein DCE44_00275, partial [Verrucomicrobiales bacterium]|nr:hypothetical protein [Verrucomicrobiales bacterium]
TMPETIPVGWVWSGRREDLLIERWDLADLFVAVTLNNRAATNAGWSVPPNSTGALGQGTVTTCFLRGTPVQLFGENGQAQTTEVVLAPQSWLYYGGKWQRTGAWNLPPSVPSGSDFAELADAFRRAPINPGSPAETPDHALAAMTNYAVAYQAWAAAGFGSPLQQDAALMQAWRALRQATSELLQAP